MADMTADIPMSELIQTQSTTLDASKDVEVPQCAELLI